MQEFSSSESDSNVVLEGDTESEDLNFRSDDEASDLQKRDIKLKNYYGIYYDKDFCVGQVTKFIEEGKTEMRLLHYDKTDTFTCPNKTDVAEVEKSFILYCPLAFPCSGPFTIKRHELSYLTKRSKLFK